MTDARPAPPIVLVDVDEEVLELLVRAATADAAADEVTPPLSPEGGWTPARTAWLRQFHRERRAGLDGPAAEATWAVVLGDEVVGSVRLARTTEPGTLETGLWLTRAVRGTGIGRTVMTAVLREATSAGARIVSADTAASNVAARSVLRRLGFDLATDAGGSRVLAEIYVGPPQ